MVNLSQLPCTWLNNIKVRHNHTRAMWALQNSWPEVCSLLILSANLIAIPILCAAENIQDLSHVCSLEFYKTFFRVELSFFLKVRRPYFGRIARSFNRHVPVRKKHIRPSKAPTPKELLMAIKKNKDCETQL